MPLTMRISRELSRLAREAGTNLTKEFSGALNHVNQALNRQRRISFSSIIDEHIGLNLVRNG